MGKKTESTQTAADIFPSSSRVRKTERKRRGWLKYVIALSAILATVYFITRKPSQRYTMTHEEWDEFIKSHPYEAPKPGDVRSPCPFLNTMANHGILPRSGKDVTYDEFFKIMTLAGVAPTTSSLFLHYVFSTYKEIDPQDPVANDWRFAPYLSLDHIGLHNILEHDVSLSRLDVFHQPDFSLPDVELVQSLASKADKTTTMLGVDQVGEFRRQRWEDSIKTNPNYHFGHSFQLVANFECVLLLDLIGRDYQISSAHLESFLINETIPEDWYPVEEAVPLFTVIQHARGCKAAARGNR